MYKLAKNAKLKGLLATARGNQVAKLAKDANRLLKTMKRLGIPVKG